MRDHPRIRGEKELFVEIAKPFQGSPPHTRGKAAAHFATFVQIRITPAYAGKSFAAFNFQDTVEDHPRIRGEKLLGVVSCVLPLGSPPHTRGKVLSEHKFFQQMGITPAYAGKRYLLLPTGHNCKDHPRIRGEKDFPYECGCVEMGSPPHTRGKEFSMLKRSCWLGITPAYAGKSPKRRFLLYRSGDHPRIRGEKVKQPKSYAGDRGSPPHTRGKDGITGYSGIGYRITPAYAGKSDQ